jgi:hypothetical protein
VKAFTQFYLTDSAERQDNCAQIYRRSLLYLVSNSFEHQRGTPILGMQKYVDSVKLIGDRPAKAEIWRWIAGPTGKDVPIPDRTSSTSHGGFSSDNDVQIAIETRIAARMGP